MLRSRDLLISVLLVSVVAPQVWGFAIILRLRNLGALPFGLGLGPQMSEVKDDILTPSVGCASACVKEYGAKVIDELHSCKDGCKFFQEVLANRDRLVNEPGPLIANERHACENKCKDTREDKRSRLACDFGCEKEDIEATNDVEKKRRTDDSGEKTEVENKEQEAAGDDGIVMSGVYHMVSKVLGYNTDVVKEKSFSWVQDQKGIHVSGDPSRVLVIHHPPDESLKPTADEDIPVDLPPNTKEGDVPTPESRSAPLEKTSSKVAPTSFWVSLCKFPDHARWVMSAILILISLTLLYMAYFVCVSAPKLHLKKESAKEQLLGSISLVPDEYEKVKEDVDINGSGQAPPLPMKVKLIEA